MTVKCTRLCYWIARPAKPGVQSSNISRVCFTVISHTPVHSGFYHIHIVDRRNCDGSCLLNLTQQSCIFFKFAICSIALLNLGETCHLKGRGMVTVWCTVLLLCCYDCESSNIMTSRCLNTYCDVTQCMNGLWIFITKTWIAQGQFINIIRTPSKQWGMCDNTLSSQSYRQCLMLPKSPTTRNHYDANFLLCHHWRHWQLTKWQLSFPPVIRKLTSSQLLVFQEVFSYLVLDMH